MSGEGTSRGLSVSPTHEKADQHDEDTQRNEKASIRLSVISA